MAQVEYRRDFEKRLTEFQTNTFRVDSREVQTLPARFTGSQGCLGYWDCLGGSS
jgi:hypothetical protein